MKRVLSRYCHSYCNVPSAAIVSSNPRPPESIIACAGSLTRSGIYGTTVGRKGCRVVMLQHCVQLGLDGVMRGHVSTDAQPSAKPNHVQPKCCWCGLRSCSRQIVPLRWIAVKIVQAASAVNSRCPTRNCREACAGVAGSRPRVLRPRPACERDTPDNQLP